MPLSLRPAFPRRFAYGLSVVVLLGAIARLGYLLALPAHDPTFLQPILDGAYYVGWAQALGTGATFAPGAYYLAPLPAYWLLLLGAKPVAVAGANLVLSLASAVFAGIIGRCLAGDVSGWGAAAILLAYHPLLFFSAYPLGESLGVALLLAGVVAWVRGGLGGAAGAGGLWGLAALARPNLLLVPIAAATYELFRRDRRRALLVATALAVVIAPVAIHNLRASGHLVPISSNGGITLFHGNGPDAKGTYQPAPGLSGSVATQREEATAAARAATGATLDDVQADAWWARQAIRARLADPLGSLALIGRKIGLSLDDAEHGLDYAPRLDRNPWRWTAPVPFAVILALAVLFLADAGARNDTTRRMLVALGAAGSVLVVFYVSSRYRLPFAVLLSVLAGAGFARAFVSNRRTPRLAALGALAVSLAIPSASIVRWSDAAGLANIASARRRAGDLTGAEADLRLALAQDADSVSVLYNLGVVLQANGRGDEAEAMYRRALAIDPGSAEAAANLGSLLIEQQRPAEAVPILRAALERRPADRSCWTNLVVALAADGKVAEARDAAAAAKTRGVTLDPGLLEEIGVKARP